MYGVSKKMLVCLITIFKHHHVPGGGGECHRKGRGRGFLGTNASRDTDDQVYINISNTSQGFQNNYFGLDAMNNPRKSIYGDAPISID